MKIHVLAKRFGPPAKTSRDFEKKTLFCSVSEIPCVSTSWIVSQNPLNEKNM